MLGNLPPEAALKHRKCKTKARNQHRGAQRHRDQGLVLTSVQLFHEDSSRFRAFCFKWATAKFKSADIVIETGQRLLIKWNTLPLDGKRRLGGAVLPRSGRRSHRTYFAACHAAYETFYTSVINIAQTGPSVWA